MDETETEGQVETAARSRPPPWTIKNVTPEVRNAAISAAKRSKVDIAEWLGRAILAYVKAERSMPAIVPGQTAKVIRPDSVGPRREVDAAEVFGLVQAMAAATAAGAPPSKATAKAMDALLRQRMVDARRGKPVSHLSQPPSPARQIEGGAGQTEEEQGLTGDV